LHGIPEKEKRYCVRAITRCGYVYRLLMVAQTDMWLHSHKQNADIPQRLPNLGTFTSFVM
jgi:hypothetical protein